MYTLKKLFEEALVEQIPEWFGEIEIVDPSPIPDPEFKPRWHQITGLNLGMSNDRAALYDDMGTGKALIAQAWAIWHAAMGNRCICLMPPVLLSQFASNLVRTFKGVSKYLNVGVYRAPTKEKRVALLQDIMIGDNRPDILLMSYQIFGKEAALVSHLYSALVADEAQLGNEETKNNWEINNFMGAEGEKAALVLNGTPAGKDLTKLYGFIQFTSPGTYRSRLHFNTLHVDFASAPVRIGQDSNGEDKMRDVEIIKSYRNLELLYANLFKRARRVEKKDVLELKDKNLIPFEVELSDKHYGLYKKFVTEMLLEFEDGSILNGTSSSSIRSNAMQAVVHPEILGCKERSAIFAAIDQLLEQALPLSKVVLFCHYRKTVEALAEEYKKLNPALIYGGSNSEKGRTKFLEDPSCRILIANYRSGGVGLNLQSVCSNIIAVEPTGVPGEFDQATDRIHRSGQRFVCNIYMLIAKGTAYVKTSKEMFKRKRIIGEVVKTSSFRKELLGEEVSYGGVEVAVDTYLQQHLEKKEEPVAIGWEQL